MAADLYSLTDFTTADFSTHYLIDPILPRGGIGLVYGKGSSGKTQFVFRMIKDLTESRPFLGLYDVEPADVLFIQADMPAGLFQERCQKAEPDLEEKEKIKIWHTKPMNILDPDDQDMIKEACEAIEPDLVVYDTLHKLHYLNENDAETPRLVYDSWKDAVGAEYGVTSILIHHSRKSYFYDGEWHTSKEDLRGHSSWREDADMSIRVEKTPKKGSDCQISFTRLRGEDQDDLPLNFNPETLIIEPDLSSPKFDAEKMALRYIKNGGQREEIAVYLQDDLGFSESHAFRVKKLLS